MLKATLLTKIVGAVLGLSLASSGLAYAGVEGAPNPVQEVIDVASSDHEVADEVVVAQDEGDDPPTSTADTPDEADEGKATAEGKRQAAQDYTDAVRDWTDCVRANAGPAGDEAHNPHEACGDHPHPHDHGLTDVPDQASDEGEENSQRGRERGEDARSQNRPSGDEDPAENGDEGSDDRGGKPDGTPAGPPEGVPGR